MRAKKAIGINDFLEKQFKEYPFEGNWLDSLGTPEQNFKMLVSGPKKNGKTDFNIKLAKYVSQWGKVFYNSFEEGHSKTLQDAIKRNNLQEVSGKIMFGHKETFPQIMHRFAQKGRARFLFLDSRDYMKLTADQYRQFIETYPRVAVIVICWSNTSGEPLGTEALAISYMVDIIVQVKNFIAYPLSRFGGNTPFTIWDKKKEAGTQLSLM